MSRATAQQCITILHPMPTLGLFAGDALVLDGESAVLVRTLEPAATAFMRMHHPDMWAALEGTDVAPQPKQRRRHLTLMK